MLALGTKPEQVNGGPFTPKPPFWERVAFVVWPAQSLDPAAEEERMAAADPTFADYKKSYDMSRRTLTRTSK